MKYQDLRPHQQNAVSLLRSDWKNHRTHMVYGPCGMGKTALAAYMAASYASKGMRCLFVVPYTILVGQTVDRFRQYGLPPCGVIWRDHPDYHPHRHIQIASAATLQRREWPEGIDILIIDECHLFNRSLLDAVRDTDIPVIGLSGSPGAPWMGEYYDNLVIPCSMRELINNGYLSDFEIFAPSTPDLSGVKTRNSKTTGTEYVEEEIAKIMGENKVLGCIVKNWLANGENRPTICFACNVLHAGQIANEFEMNGVSCEVMTGKTPQEERDAIVERFEAGITKIVCNVSVLTAGFDSDVRCVIFARPTKSEMVWVQSLSRGLRTAPGKENCLIFDHSCNTARLGFPDQISFDTLRKESDGPDKEKNAQAEKEKAEKLPKPCSKCSFLRPAGVLQCPKCGYRPRAGEDVESDRSVELTTLKPKDKPATKEDKQAFWSELKGWQKERAAQGKPIKDGAVAHKYREKFKVWPKGLHDTAKVPSPETRNWIQSQNIRFAKGRAKSANI